ncbi:hypothetical protein EDB19DRAFT_1834993 [Suillus lakei]|nr:hypothetical protein EDB19DRAFT_1834993 [Suillus lakei]
MEEHEEYLDIYQLQINKASTMIEIQLKLTESENANTKHPGTYQSQGFTVYDATSAQKASIEEKWQRLAARIVKFHETADAMTASMDLDIGTVHSDDPRFCHTDNDGNEWVEVSDEEISEDIDEEILIEEIGLWMPPSVSQHGPLTLRLGSLLS